MWNQIFSASRNQGKLVDVFVTLIEKHYLKPYRKRPWFAGYSIQTTVLSFPTKNQRR